MSIEEITAAIASLPAEERRRLYVALERQKAGDPAMPAYEALPTREASECKTRSAHDLAKGLIGPGSGLGDLSSNPAHMEGFGEGAHS